jgi:hypothetical protein
VEFDQLLIYYVCDSLVRRLEWLLCRMEQGQETK